MACFCMREADEKYFLHGSWEPFEVELCKMAEHSRVYKLTLAVLQAPRTIETAETEKCHEVQHYAESFANAAEEILKEEVNWHDIAEHRGGRFEDM